MRSFQNALSAGHAAERRWVESLRELGRSVCHGRKLVLRGHDKNRDHCETPDALALFSVEIKERSLEFDDCESFPFDTVFVDDLRGLEKERAQNLIYVFISKPTGQWVWLTILDRDETWSEGVTFDRGRGHEVPVLIAPKSVLRPAEELVELIYPHLLLDLVDGDTTAFLSGGGATESRDRIVAKDNPELGARDSAAPGKADKRLGKR
jgi:hypothetical protein